MKPEHPDRIFINHIEAHLEKGQKVICKICGKTAEEIIADVVEEKHET